MTWNLNCGPLKHLGYYSLNFIKLDWLKVCLSLFYWHTSFPPNFCSCVSFECHKKVFASNIYHFYLYTLTSRKITNRTREEPKKSSYRSWTNMLLQAKKKKRKKDLCLELVNRRQWSSRKRTYKLKKTMSFFRRLFLLPISVVLVCCIPAINSAHLRGRQKQQVAQGQ